MRHFAPTIPVAKIKELQSAARVTHGPIAPAVAHDEIKESPLEQAALELYYLPDFTEKDFGLRGGRFSLVLSLDLSAILASEGAAPGVCHLSPLSCRHVLEKKDVRSLRCRGFSAPSLSWNKALPSADYHLSTVAASAYFLTSSFTSGSP
ncbi:uncharacterized protein BT62DRAFT_217087 [Guyanagaster necrorhizus]|uniref:Uncharacterized protein n=1 Tax=Guyanagaster necrorhizus TaxID=856835 RepID=A0A9P7VNU8_9AGAR|nr:uncharacterized protein BT62DRAFT_217087 [Guyanagaster necrorhizus MCA 3950]KAG7444631.1 hypothetical protein BT62DRAFT_217087 [Guyanagaster necrorhizus MCA 3950]